MAKVNDTQTLLLSGASQRENGSLLPLPDGRTPGVRVTKAIDGLLAFNLIDERETSDRDAEHRVDGDLSFGLFITAAGLQAIGLGDSTATAERQEDVGAGAPADQAESPSPVPRRTKTAAVLALLSREDGATLPELITATGWLPHTTRAALTGLRKKGHELERSKRDGATCYRVAAVMVAG